MTPRLMKRPARTKYDVRDAGYAGTFSPLMAEVSLTEALKFAAHCLKLGNSVTISPSKPRTNVAN